MNGDVQAWLDEATVRDLQPPCDWVNFHEDDPPPAEFVIRWSHSPCGCPRPELACSGCAERKIAQRLLTPTGSFECHRCGSRPFYITSIEPL